MFSSVKPWVNIPFTIKPYVGRAGSGAKLFGPSVSALCYPEGEIKIVKNTSGKEVVSTKQLFVFGDTQVTELDNVVFEGLEDSIEAIEYFYRNGVVDYKVVHL